MSIDTKITLFENSNRNLCKHIKADGTKTSHAVLSSGVYKTISISSLKAFGTLLKSLSPSQAIGLGIASDKSREGSIVTRNYVTEGSIARSKKYFTWNEREQILLFDYDFFKEMNKEMKISTPEEYRRLLIKLDDKFLNAEMLIVPSSSNGIYNNQNKVVSDSKGMHCYIVVNCIENINIWVNNLSARAWELKLACIKFSKDGKRLSRTIFDKAVFSPERLIFEASPTLDEGLIQNKTDALYVDGNVIDISDVNTLNKNDTEDKAYEAASKKSQIIESIYIKDSIKEKIKQGFPIDEAEIIVKSRCQDGMIDRNDIVVFSDNSKVLAKDLTTKHNGKYCLDPIEPNQENAIINVDSSNSIMIYSFLHGGRKFYVKDEEFKHHSLPIVRKPVNPDTFNVKFSEKWKNFGNVVTPPLEETWKLNCIAMNNAIVSDRNIKYIVPAVTGSGKTESIITYCTMLPQHITVIICTKLTAEADRIAEAINREALKNIAIASHTQSEISNEDASTYQVVVVSHQFYIRHYKGDEKWNKFANRDLTIIDEALDTMSEISVSAQEINRVIDIINDVSTWKKYQDNQQLKDELYFLRAEYECLINTHEDLGSGTKLINSEQMNGIKLSMLDLNLPINMEDLEIKDVLENKYKTVRSILLRDENIRYNKILTTVNSVPSDGQIKKTLLKTLRKLEMLPGGQIYVTANQGQYSYNKVIDVMPNHSVVCFDATADVNKTYNYRAKYHNDQVNIKRVECVREYSNVNLYIAKINTGKSTIDKTYVENLMSNVKPGDKTLIIAHKAKESLFLNYISEVFPGKNIAVTHWGALTGLNSWQDFDTCIIAGLNHKPTHYTQNRVIVSTNEETAFGVNQHHIASLISITGIASEIIQAINRIRVRKIVNINGGCLSANIYLTLPFDSEQYKKLISSQMIGINMQEWTIPENTSNGGARPGFLPAIISYLENTLSDSDEISIDEPRDVLGILKDSYKKIINKDSFKEALKSISVEIVEKNKLDKYGRKLKKPDKYLRKITESTKTGNPYK